MKCFEIERHPGYSRLTLGADLNAFHWEELQRSAQEILNELESGRHRAVIVDLTRLDYLGSAQLTVLVRVWKVIKERNGRMIIEVTGPVVREVLKAAGLLNLWEFAESRAAAFQMLGLQADGRRKMSMVLPGVGLAALAAAVGGVCLTIWRADAVDARVVLAGQLACSAIALGAGLWTAIRGSGVRRGLGAGMVVASALVAVAVVFHHPR
ncbi:MAG: STAS domain-containing protein [Deltaproteobacteria bacterium]